MKNRSVVGLLKVALISAFLLTGCLTEEESALQEQITGGSTFDVEVSLNQQRQSATIVVPGDAMKKLGVVTGLNGGTPEGLLQERLQWMTDRGSGPLHGDRSQGFIGARPDSRNDNLRPEDPPEDPGDGGGGGGDGGCIVPAWLTYEYYIYYNYPSCQYYAVIDLYQGYYNQCTGSWGALQYQGSWIYGPYGC
jgi:hypothetical protein